MTTLHPSPIHPHPVDPLHGFAADTPFVLLPVRLETRWFATNDPAQLELRVRVYPDEIHVARTPTVTTGERADVAAYLALRASQPEAAAALYARLVETCGASRAAWLVRVLAPNAPAVADADTDESPTFASAMPAYWIGIAKSSTVRVVATSNPVARDLAVAPVKGDEVVANSPALGSQLAWLHSFADAERKGMTLRFLMASADAAKLDELIVIGVPAADPTAAAGALGELLERHAARDGAAFLAPGTATKIARDRDAARDTGSAGPWRGGGGRPLSPIGANPTGDPARALNALGVTGVPDIVADDYDRDVLTRTMHVALWPATWGYYLEDLAAQDPATLAGARALMLDHVRPAGVFPTLALRRQPYGLLPATTLAHWPAAAARGGLAALVTRAFAGWTAAVAHVPRLLESNDVDGDLVKILRRSPRSLGAWIRQVLDKDTASVSLGGIAGLQQELDRVGRELAALLLGLPANMPVLELVYKDGVAKLGIPLVAAGSVSRTEPLPQDYLAGIASATSSALAANQVAGADPRTLLYLLARYAATHVQWSVPPVAVASRTIATRTIAAPTTMTRTLASSVWSKIATLGDAVFTNPAVAEHRAALRALGQAPVGELEIAFAGVLDSASFRIDAWATALAAERLAALRSSKPVASHVGGWAFLERPRPATQPAPTGFIHAPSVAQARTAAVLRAAYEAHRTDDPTGNSLAIDLSSQRVRDARWLLDGMRDGRPIGRLLGEHLEAWLVGKGHPELVHTLRAGADLADGWALYHQWLAAAPAAPLGEALADLTTLLDGLSDLLVAETVHEAIANSPARTGAALDALQRGEIAAPDPRVDRTSTDGKRVDRRVVLRLPASGGWNTTKPRAVAAPGLEAFAASVLGNPATATMMIDGSPIALSSLEVCALDAVVLAASGERAFLDLAARTAPAATTVTGGPALDELIMRGAALSRLFRAARTPQPGDLGAVTISAPVDRSASVAAAIATLDAQTTRMVLATGFAAPAPIQSPASLAAVTSKPGALTSWLSDMGRVRPALEALDLIALVAPQAVPLERRRTSDGVELVLAGAGDEALVIDGWSEAPPATTIATGVAFPYQAPRSQPPQAILLAVPPPETPWSLPVVEAIIDETFARARARMISPDDVRNQIVPTVLVQDDPDDLVPSIDLQIVSVVEEVMS